MINNRVGVNAERANVRVAAPASSLFFAVRTCLLRTGLAKAMSGIGGCHNVHRLYHDRFKRPRPVAQIL